MAYEIRYVPSAVKALRKLDRATAQRLLAAIGDLHSNPRPAGCVQLKGGAGEYRIRVGDFRIIYDVYDAEVVVLVLKIGHRREVYR